MMNKAYTFEQYERIANLFSMPAGRISEKAINEALAEQARLYPEAYKAAENDYHEKLLNV